MVKVILDFPNIRDSEDLDKHLQAMAEVSKKTAGFLFCTINADGSANSQLYCISSLELAGLIMELEEKNPEVKMIKMMHEMTKRGGGMRGPFGI